MTVKFDTETIRLMTIFENLTGVAARDCIIEGNVVYLLVDEDKMGMAIGKNGDVVRNVEKMINRTVKLFGFSTNLEKFIRNIIPRALNVKIIKRDGKTVVEVEVEKSEKPILIGREGKNLKILKELVRRNHDVDDLRII